MWSQIHYGAGYQNITLKGRGRKRRKRVKKKKVSFRFIWSYFTIFKCCRHTRRRHESTRLERVTYVTCSTWHTFTSFVFFGADEVTLIFVPPLSPLHVTPPVKLDVNVSTPARLQPPCLWSETSLLLNLGRNPARVITALSPACSQTKPRHDTVKQTATTKSRANGRPL